MTRPFALACIFVGLSAAAFGLNTTATELRSFLDDKREKIEITFLGNLKNEPSVTYGPGWMRVMFPEATYSRELDFVRINDGFVRAIRFFPSVKGSLMEIEFTAPEFDGSGRTDLKIVNGNVELVVNTTDSLDETPAEFAENPPPLKPEEAEAAEPLPKPAIGENWYLNAFQVTLALIFVLLLFLGLVKLYRKYLFSEAAFTSSRRNVRMISSHMLASKHKILVIEIGGKQYAVGMGPGGVGLIARLENEDDESFRRIVEENKDSSLADLRMKFLHFQKKKSLAASKAEPARKTFSQELHDRLRKLKPIN